ncbi:MAG: DUF2804 domain-containing protein [Candidatus Nanopelagicales bacterium]|nr:DUF2804 domain-containing protein [Candidatus Nanopelagicales bacterium]
MAEPTAIRYSAPMHVVGPHGPRFGDYQGLTPALRPPGAEAAIGQKQVADFLRHKRWMYTFAATQEVIVTCAIVDAGPTGTTFMTVADRRTGRLLADISRPGGTRPLVSVNDRPGEGHRSRYRMPGTEVSMHTEDGVLHVRAKVGSPVGLPAIGKPSVELELAFDITASPALTVISDLDTDPPMVSTTGKNANLPVTGRVVVRQAGILHAFDFTDAIGGFDFTSGHLPRHTLWRWAYMTGRMADGRKIGLNLSADFSGLTGRARENSVWFDGELHAIDPDASIEFDTADPEKPWQVRTSDGRVDLVFNPVGVHRESLNLRVIRSKFLQPVGEFTGTIQLNRGTLQIEGLPGVAENQDTLW